WESLDPLYYNLPVGVALELARATVPHAARDFMRRLLEVLKPYPEARKAAAEALCKGEKEGASGAGKEAKDQPPAATPPRPQAENNGATRATGQPALKRSSLGRPSIIPEALRGLRPAMPPRPGPGRPGQTTDPPGNADPSA